MKSQYFPLILLCCVVLAGCGKDKKKTNTARKGKQEVFTQVDIPTAGENLRFDDFGEEFVRLDDNIEADAALSSGEEFAWLEEDDVAGSDEFEVVRFDFDRSSISPDQEPIVETNISLALELIEGGAEDVTIAIDGHSCNSAGSRAYNLALSEKRAKTLRDRFVEAGVPADRLKIVARGSEIPAVVNGHPVTGDRMAQAPNRRDEVHVIYS